MPFAPQVGCFGAFPSWGRYKAYCVAKAVPQETPVKVLINLAAVSLSIVLGLIPFAVIAVNDVAVAMR